MRRFNVVLLIVAILSVAIYAFAAGMTQKVTTHPNSIYRWMFESTVDRVFNRGYDSTDLGRVALQTDNSTLWLLTATTPTWRQILALQTANALTAGAILYHDGTSLDVLPPGTNGQVLKMNAAGLPEWGSDLIE